MDGILIINKPKEYTSHDIVAKVKKIYKTKVGHTGTLDPMATGVLPLLLGEGTKLSEYLTNHDKEYEAVIQLGIKTDTADSEGKIVEEKEINIKNLQTEKIQKIFSTFIGKQKQTPPMYSAIKVKGKKLYEYARANEKVDIPEREIEIYKMELIQIQENLKTIKFRVKCSKGTYIRTLCEMIAQKLNTVGYMKELNRIKVGNFSIEQAISLELLEKNVENKIFLESKIITIQKFFENIPCICLEPEKIRLLKNGVQLTTQKPDGLYQIKEKNGNWIGIGTIYKKLLKRKIILQEK